MEYIKDTIYSVLANAVDNALITIQDNQCNPPVNRLITRSPKIVSLFGHENFPFQHRDSTNGVLQVYDVLINDFVKININSIDDITYHSLPHWLSPSVITNSNNVVNKDAFYNLVEPFIREVKKAKEDDCFYPPTVIAKNEFNHILSFLSYLTQYKLKIKNQNMYNYIQSDFHKRCNKKLYAYVKENFNILLTYPFLKITNAFKIETVEDLRDILADKKAVIEAWSDVLNRTKDVQIKKYESECEVICKEKFAGEEHQQERDFLKLQYDKAVDDIKNLNIATQLAVYENNLLLLLRYWPVEFDKLAELTDTMQLNHYEHSILQLLLINGITVQQDDIDLVSIQLTTAFEHEATTIIDQLTTKYLDVLKKIRMQQIREHAETIVNTVLEEIDDLDKDDIDDIVSSIRDFDSFQERINAIDNIAGILQYWPSILLPAPINVRRLGTVTQEALDIFLSGG